MTWKEIASIRLTGISSLWLGVSWNPSKRHKDIANKLMTFLEDRRVLFNPYELENPVHCQQSVIQIREFITELLFDVDTDTEIAIALRMIRASCRKFLDTIEYNKDSPGLRYRYEMGMGEGFVFDSAMGELRAAIGFQIAQLMVMFKLDCEGELLLILPPPID